MRAGPARRYFSVVRLGATSLIAAWLLVVAVRSAAAQGIPTGVIRGQVRDPSNLPVPGVSVTATSTALQDKRSVVTSDNGEFIIPFLPSGEYSVAFERVGFVPQHRTIDVAILDTSPINVMLTLAGVDETVNVSGTASSEVARTITMAETYQAAALERLPVGRTLDDAVLLAPGVSPNGPLGHIVISGAPSYENLSLINGVTDNDFLAWGEATPLYIEDAIQETKISTGNISAEYGRFQGGVVNVVTKSGGNALSGSFRTSLTDNAWRALTPYPDPAHGKRKPSLGSSPDPR